MGIIPAKNDGLSGLWRSIARHKLLFATIVGVCCLVGGLYILAATPQYRADALLRVQIKPGASISALSDVSGTMSSDQSADDETDVLSSRTIVGEAIAATGSDTVVRTESYFPLIGRYFASRHAASNRLRKPFLGLSGFAWGGEQLKPGIFQVPDAALGEKFRVVTGEDGNWTLYDKDDHQRHSRSPTMKKPGLGNCGSTSCARGRVSSSRCPDCRRKRLMKTSAVG
jgi:tyrosine-protein kinase Etk/Wzc